MNLLMGHTLGNYITYIRGEQRRNFGAENHFALTLRQTKIHGENIKVNSPQNKLFIENVENRIFVPLQ